MTAVIVVTHDNINMDQMPLMSAVASVKVTAGGRRQPLKSDSREGVTQSSLFNVFMDSDHFL